MICNICGSTNDNDTKFCTVCGAQMQENNQQQANPQVNQQMIPQMNQQMNPQMGYGQQMGQPVMTPNMNPYSRSMNRNMGYPSQSSVKNPFAIFAAIMSFLSFIVPLMAYEGETASMMFMSSTLSEYKEFVDDDKKFFAVAGGLLLYSVVVMTIICVISVFVKVKPLLVLVAIANVVTLASMIYMINDDADGESIMKYLSVGFYFCIVSIILTIISVFTYKEK